MSGPPASRLTADQVLERTQWDFFWIPPGTRVVDRPELAFLTSRQEAPMLNSVTRTRAPPDRLPALLSEVGAAHARVTSQWLVPPTFDTEPLQRLLAERGWVPTAHHRGYTVATDAGLGGAKGTFAVRRVTTLAELRDALAVADRAFGGGGRRFSQAELEAELLACTHSQGRVRRFVAYDADGAPVSSGAYSLFPALGFGYLFAGATLPETRGRGAYSAVLAARVTDARRQGLGRVGLYARTDTSAPIVARRGFEAHGPMTYWQRPRPIA